MRRIAYRHQRMIMKAPRMYIKVYQSKVSVSTLAWPEKISDQRLELPVQKLLVQEGGLPAVHTTCKPLLSTAFPKRDGRSRFASVYLSEPRILRVLTKAAVNVM
jgi:hypothetical protein